MYQIPVRPISTKHLYKDLSCFSNFNGMRLKIGIVFLTAFSVLVFTNMLYAQNLNNVAKDTFETIFHNVAHKDGYEVGGEIMDIPENIARKCDKKKIRVLGGHSNYKAIYDAEHDADTSEIRQGRYEYIPSGGDTGEIKWERRFVSAGSTFSITSIALWNKAKRKWEVIYRPGKY